MPNSAIGETDVTTGRQFRVDRGGTFTDIVARFVVPAGSMLAPQPPAAVVAGNVETSRAITGALYAAPGVQAEGSGTMNHVTFGNAHHQYYEIVVSGSGAGNGFPGALGANRVERADGTVTDLGGSGAADVGPGDVLVIETPGGGGYGPPSSHPHPAGEETDDLRAF